jgi:hypothetical protein
VGYNHFILNSTSGVVPFEHSNRFLVSTKTGNFFGDRLSVYQLLREWRKKKRHRRNEMKAQKKKRISKMIKEEKTEEYDGGKMAQQFTQQTDSQLTFV